MENKKKISTIAEDVDIKEKYAADLDQALAVAGFGWYNIKYCLVLALVLIAGIIESVGYSLVMPAAMCDLQITDSQRGFISSIPYIGIILTSFAWGYVLDTRGRKIGILYSSLVAGVFGIISAFMPNLISYAVCKAVVALCIACPAAAPYTYIGEILPAKHRDVMLSITNALQISGTALVPMLAWAILPLDFRIDFGLYMFRPWRLLSFIYPCFFILSTLLLIFAPESPKYLVSQGRFDEALEVLQVMYAGNNKNKAPEDFPIKRLITPPHDSTKISFLTSLKIQSVPLLKPPFLKWFALNGFLMFGIFTLGNGLYMWVPDILNRVLTGDGAGRTACEVIFDRFNQTQTGDAECIDTIDNLTFVISTVGNICCAVIAVVVSSAIKFIGKKRLLIVVYCLLGVFCILINFITQDIVFAVLLSALPLIGLCLGPVNAYAVEFFPTNLRGMAVSLTMMLGRSGSIIGINVTGILINAACEATFYIFGGLLLLCGSLSFLLPASKEQPTNRKQQNLTQNITQDVTKL